MCVYMYVCMYACMYMYVCMLCVYVPCIRACMRERVSVIQWKLTNNRKNISGVRFKTTYL